MAEPEPNRCLGTRAAEPGCRPLDDNVAALYDSRFADRYNLTSAIWEQCFCRRTLRAFDDRLRLLTRRPLRILDLGCGTGRNLDRLAAAGVVIGSYTGVDRSPRMLGRASRNHPYSCVDFVLGEAIDAATTASDYDVVLATWILSHQPDPAALIAAARQALAPDGHLLVLALTATDQPAGRALSWRFRRFLHATPIDPALIGQAIATNLTVSGAGLATFADIAAASRPRFPTTRRCRSSGLRPTHHHEPRLLMHHNQPPPILVCNTFV